MGKKRTFLIGGALITILMLSIIIANRANSQEVNSSVVKAEAGLPKEKSNQIEATSGTTLFETVKRGGALMIPIMLLALIGVTLVIERIIFYIRKKTWNMEKLEEHINLAKGNSKAKYREELENDLHNSVQVFVNDLEKGLPLINGIGNLAPILGFFGTVVGMIEAFAAIAAATTVNAKVVAVGIQIALVTTAGGLAVAVPMLFFFHFFTHIIHKTYAQADTLINNSTASLPYLSTGNDVSI